MKPKKLRFDSSFIENWRPVTYKIRTKFKFDSFALVQNHVRFQRILIIILSQIPIFEITFPHISPKYS